MRQLYKMPHRSPGGSDTVEQAEPRVTRCDYHLNASSRLSFNSGLQCVRRTPFRSRATPGVDGNVGRLGRVALIGRAVNRIRREEKFHALDVSGRRAVAFIHVTATDPFCARRHADLVARAIIADRGAGGVRAVKEIIARERANRFRKGCRRCHESNRASCNCGWRSVRPSRDNEV